MRLRNDTNAINILLANQKWYVHDPLSIKSDKGYLDSKPNYLEIGMGKGQFIINNALAYPDINYIGLELNRVICSKAIKKILATNEPLDNLKILNANALVITEIFNPQSIDKIFLNFSDPWPKKRHTKNRLTNPRFLELYRVILKPDAVVELKTDNDGLYAYTMEVLEENKDKYQLIYNTTDLYADLNNSLNANNIPTEYETRFHSEGKNINKIIFKFI